MDYERKYKEALEKARQLCLYPTTKPFISDLQNLFPELRESDDERIRKSLLDYFNRYKEQEECGIKTFYGIPTDDILAWLENQGNPTDINPSEFDLRLNKLLKQFETLPKEELANSLSFYLNVVQNDGTYKPDEKQGGQKPVDKVESFDEFEGLTDFERTLADICIGWIGEELGWKQYIKDNADVLLKIAIEKFNSVQDASFEQKPAWSEEDEAMLDTMGGWLDTLCEYLKDSSSEYIPNVESCINWLKQLKQRIGG